MAPTKYEEVDGDEKSSGCSTMSMIGAGCGCLMVVLVGGNYAFKNYAVNAGFEGFISISDKWTDETCNESYGFSIENSVERMWLPGYGYKNKNLSALGEFGSPCYPDDLLIEWDAFNRKFGGKQVSYSSRIQEGDKVAKLGGWWLPAPTGSADAPRIVLQHGFTSNSNKWRQMFAAYLLRDLGFNVLVNNFRDHCYSQNLEPHLNQWGDAYPYDVLGAWDYAVKDPDGILGGPMDPAKVGLMGFSKGAFTVNNAFGLEAKVPAAWVDGPPWTPKSAFLVGFSGAIPGFLASLYGDSVWSGMSQKAKDQGVVLNENTPEKSLQQGPDTKRPLMLSSNKGDLTVAYNDRLSLAAFVNTVPEKYAFSQMIFEKSCVLAEKGSGYSIDHCGDHFAHHDHYKSKLCMFWKSAFNLPTDSCPIYPVVERKLTGNNAVVRANLDDESTVNDTVEHATLSNETQKQNPLPNRQPVPVRYPMPSPQVMSI